MDVAEKFLSTKQKSQSTGRIITPDPKAGPPGTTAMKAVYAALIADVQEIFDAKAKPA